MCSILGILDIKTDAQALRKQAIKLSRNQRHRGPDWSGTYASDNAILVHERLSIVDVDSGAQPLYSPDGKNILAVNGEIYNHKDLEQALKQDFTFQTHSDCEVILALYNERADEKDVAFLNEIKGMFAFIDRKSVV